ncbi:MAG: lamin tail domain-containing protein [Cyclobacteriaceae bacterium]|nr:lamin tail domain-containing protein [Cyclobacteriaceae bacterium]
MKISEEKNLLPVFINEIMFDPNPVQGLPDLEYVELFNAGGETINLFKWALNDGVFPACLLQPGEYLIVCKKGKEGVFLPYGNTIGIEPWDVLNNDGQEVILEDGTGSVVDKIYYTPALIKETDKKNGGWSVEMMNPAHTCKGTGNWNVSSDPAGGTPGRINSIYSSEPDLIPPGIISLNWTGLDTLQITFSEPLELLSDEHAGSFVFIPFLEILHVLSDENEHEKIWLILRKRIRGGDLYTLSVSGISDCTGNMIRDTLIHTGFGKQPSFHDLLITELMVDELPSAGLPESEYLELFNRTGQIIGLESTMLLNGSDTFKLPGGNLMPGQYFVFCPGSKIHLFTGIPDCRELSPFPRLLNEGGILALLNVQNQLVFSLRYDKGWYQDLEKSTGGFSLEMIDLSNPCGEGNNWRASDSPSGGTPGLPNSVSESNPDLSGPGIRNVYMPERALLAVDLTEKLNPSSLNDLEIQLSGIGGYSIQSFDSLFYDSFSISLSAPLSNSVQYEIQIRGLRDCVGNNMDPEKNLFNFYLPEPALAGDLIINEILFNPKPGGVHWVEIYNRSAKYIDLSNLAFSDVPDGSGISMALTDAGHPVLKPSGLMVFTEDRNKLLADFPESLTDAIFEIKELPDMPDQFGNIVLISDELMILDHFYYSSDYHHDLVTDDEGVSLERISYAEPTNDPANWHSASSISGYGSPTFENSTHISSLPDPDMFLLDPEIITPDGDGYNDQLYIHYITGNPGYTGTIEVYDISGQRIKTIIKNRLLSVKGSINWDGYSDRGQIPRTGMYILRFEIYNLSGDYKQAKRRFVISKKS